MPTDSICSGISTDIIIPIYNAFDYVTKCLETVLAHTDLVANRLVLINDKSSDSRILPFLQSFVQEHASLDIVLIDNEENQGFVRTVNRGMSYSNRDVVLLNSDTEVTRNWLVKLRACAYSKPCVATVTPLSNNATIASVPRFCEENPQPTGYSIDEYADRVEACSLRLYPELPTAHGFCVYIRREALQAVGLFDAETFGKGYGEENDFSYRCLQLGYRHLMCDDTYIYHKGTQSFSKEKQQFIDNNLRLLKKRYPFCFEQTAKVVFENPYQAIQRNVRYGVEVESRPNILFVVHDFQLDRMGNIGGTSLHIHDLIRDLRLLFNIHVCYYAPTEENYLITSFFPMGEETAYVGGPYPHYTAAPFYNEEWKADLTELITALHIDVIHIHHLKNQYLDIFQIARDQRIPVAYTFHDFYALCPSIQMLRPGERFCEAHDISLCADCLNKLPAGDRRSAALWRKEISRHLSACDKLIVPSCSVQKQVKQVFPNWSLEVIEHGYDMVPNTLASSESENYSADSSVFRVAFLGGISPIKGLRYLKGLVKEAEQSEVEIHLFGLTSEKAYNRSQGNYHYHGTYLREDLPRLLKEHHIDLVCLLSLCPETYSYTLSECMVSSLPVITLDVGATAERVKKSGAGWVMPRTCTPQDVWQQIMRIHKELHGEYAEKKKAAEVFLRQIPSIAAMNETYAQLYHQLIAESNQQQVSLEAANRCKLNFYARNSTLLLRWKQQQKAEDLFRAMKRLIKGKSSTHRVYKEILRYCKKQESVEYRGLIWQKFIVYRLLGFWLWSQRKE